MTYTGIPEQTLLLHGKVKIIKKNKTKQNKKKCAQVVGKQIALLQHIQKRGQLLTTESQASSYTKDTYSNMLIVYCLLSKALRGYMRLHKATVMLTGLKI